MLKKWWKRHLTSRKHKTGTDRIYEAFTLLDKNIDFIMNVQGDEPDIDVDDIRTLHDKMRLINQKLEH